MAGNISRWTRAGCGASNWPNPMRMASGFSAASWTDLRKAQKKNAGRRGRPASLSNPRLIGVTQAEIELPSRPAAMVEALADGVEVGNHRFVAQVDALGGDGAIVGDLVAGGCVIVETAFDEHQIITVARIDAASVEILTAERRRDAGLEDTIVIIEGAVVAGARHVL